MKNSKRESDPSGEGQNDIEGKWRRESVQAGGNAIVPHIAYVFFKIIDAIENVFEPDPTT